VLKICKGEHAMPEGAPEGICIFPTKYRLWVLKIPILPQNFLKIGVFIPKFCIIFRQKIIRQQKDFPTLIRRRVGNCSRQATMQQSRQLAALD